MPESHNTEWKTIWKDEYLAELGGFANAQGGTLQIGIDDNGEPVGLKDSKKLLVDIPNKIRDALGIVAKISLKKKKGMEYIEIHVPSYEIPISCKGLYYIRSGSTNQKLSGPELESFILRRRGATWDNSPLPGFTMDDIDNDALELFKELAIKKKRLDFNILKESKEAMLDKLRLKNGDFLTNAAMLLFGKDPDKWLLGAYTKVGFFETDADLIYHDELHGPLLKQPDRIIELVCLKYMKAKITYEGLQRIERYFTPDEALREALLNALVHKDYSSEIPIQISVYNDRLYIANCGRLPENWTLDNLLKKHASKPFNPHIAHVFYLAGFIEHWGRGIEKIHDSCRKEACPMPEYTVNPGDIMIKFTAPGDWLSSQVTDKVTDKEKELLSLLTENPAYTSNELAVATTVSRQTILLRIKSLKEKGIIKRIGSNRKGHWEIISD